MGFHHCDLRLCITLRLTSLASTPDKEVSIGYDEQTEEDKCVSHLYSYSSASLDAASFALADEKRLMWSVTQHLIVQINGSVVHISHQLH